MREASRAAVKAMGTSMGEKLHAVERGKRGGRHSEKMSVEQQVGKCPGLHHTRERGLRLAK